MTVFDDDAVTDVIDAHTILGAERFGHYADALSVTKVIDRHWQEGEA
jgi:hypothetical protein